MVGGILGIITKTRSKVLEFITGLMGGDMRESGNREKEMDLEKLFMQTAQKDKAIGLMIAEMLRLSVA